MSNETNQNGSFNVEEFEFIINDIKKRIENAKNAIQGIHNYAYNVGNTISSSNEALKEAWYNIGNTTNEISNKMYNTSYNFINLLETYKENTLANETSWGKDVNASQHYLDNINEKISTI